MNTKFFLHGAASLLALSLCAVPASAASASEADALPVFNENYIKFSAGGISYDGNKASGQARTQVPKVGAAGIEAFNYTKELSKVTTMIVEGQALPGAEDYLLSVNLTKNEVGSFEAGYRTFRTFYDGAGAFFPTNNVWMAAMPRALYVDRGRFHVGGTVNLPGKPVFTFRYTMDTRDGRKDSTILGDTSFTGIPNYSQSALNPVSIARKLLPAYIDMDEKQHTLTASARHTFGKTTAMLSLVGSRIDNFSSRNVDRFVGELRPFPTIPANPLTIIPPQLSNNPNRGFDNQGRKEDAFTIMATVETEISDKIMFYAGASYRAADGDITGSRLITITMSSNTGPISGVGGFTSAGRPPYSYTSEGTIKSDLYVANAGLRLKPAKDLALDVGLKAEDYNVTASNLATYISTFMVQATGAVATPQRDVSPNNSKTIERLWAPEVSTRYTGLKKLILFASADWRTSPGDERHMDTHVGPGPAGSSIVVSAVGEGAQKVDEKHLNAKVGGVWSPGTVLNVRAEAYTKNHETRFDGYGVSAGSLYVLDYDIVGTRVTATYRPTPTWSCATRYALQVGKTATMTDIYARGDSKDSKRHSIAETVNWVPNKNMFVQANATLVYDTISTAYPDAGGLANDVLRNADNNFWNGSIIAGFVVDKVTNAQIEGTYYKANNYDPAIATATVPYGFGGREYTVSLGVTRKLSARWLASGKVGYLDNRNDTSGGNTNFRGPLGYLSMQRAF
jgi:hypothetical protein